MGASRARGRGMRLYGQNGVGGTGAMTVKPGAWYRARSPAAPPVVLRAEETTIAGVFGSMSVLLELDALVVLVGKGPEPVLDDGCHSIVKYFGRGLKPPVASVVGTRNTTSQPPY